jgi:hypothetical protein
MKLFKTPTWFKRLSIRSKLYTVVGIMAALIGFELFMLWFTINTLSAVRALVGAEGLWSKSQKNAAFALYEYATTRDEKDFVRYRDYLKVPLGDRKTRLELMKPNYNHVVAYQGFYEGAVHPDDIDGMINVLRRFNRVSYIHDAIGVWTAGDSMLTHFMNTADSLRWQIIVVNPNQNNIAKLTKHVSNINAELTILEDRFSFVLGEGSRWLEGVVLTLLFITALTVEVTGLLMSFFLSRSIANGISSITNAASEIEKGNLRARAEVLSEDELGTLAQVFNNMASTLDNKIHELERAEAKLIGLLREVKESNQELKNFAYIVSHDLKTPLRGIVTLANWVLTDYNEKLDEQGKENLALIVNRTSRMNDLIDGILQYSRASQIIESKMRIDTNVLVPEVIDFIAAPAHFKIEITNTLPTVDFERVKLFQIFQNLIGNAVKYIDKEEGLIRISCEKTDGFWTFAVSDNGPGIEEKYFEKIFQIFQTLSVGNNDNTGIGLTIVKKIVEANKGTIWVTSKPQEGSTFHFTIPVNNA